MKYKDVTRLHLKKWFDIEFHLLWHTFQVRTSQNTLDGDGVNSSQETQIPHCRAVFLRHWLLGGVKVGNVCIQVDFQFQVDTVDTPRILLDLHLFAEAIWWSWLQQSILISVPSLARLDKHFRDRKINSQQSFIAFFYHFEHLYTIGSFQLSGSDRPKILS